MGIQRTKNKINASTDLTQVQTIHSYLESLLKSSNHHEINDVIDEILTLVCHVFASDYASVYLIDNRKMAGMVRYYHHSEGKLENINYALTDFLCDKVVQTKAICLVQDIKQQFPQNVLSKKMNVNSSLAGPIISTEGKIVGVMNILKKQKINLNDHNNILFRLFLERINLEIERLLSQKKLQFLINIAQQDPNPFIQTSPSGKLIFANTQGTIMFEYWMNIFSGLPNSMLYEALQAKTTNEAVRFEMESGNKTYLFTLIWTPDFQQINIYGTDISQFKTTEQDMINLARYDALTRVANRQYFEEKILDKIHAHSLADQKLGVLLIDLDDFKIINDTFGHPVGDSLLKAATARMSRCLREDDFIARLGGDEFIVLLSNSSEESAVLVAEKLINVLARTFIFGEYHMKISASIGVSIYPQTAQTSSDLLRYADIAMYQAKQSGKNNYAVFSKSLHYIQDKRNDILKRDLRFAATKNELYVSYQPQFDMNSNRMIGIEALLRWRHPEQGLILPNEFISLAERTGCIHLISQWLIEQVLSDFVTFLKSNADINLSINVSLSQLNDARFLDSFCDNLLEFNIKRSLIILDISERSIAPNFKQMAKIIKKIQKSGIKTCIDNFGSPQVSLPELLALPIDYLKLDKQLLQGIEKSEKHRMLLKGIINLAKELHLNVIQKGIETKEQHYAVRSMGCLYAQGFYYCKPVGINELQQFMDQDSFQLTNY